MSGACRGGFFSESGRPSVLGSHLERSWSPPDDELVPAPNMLDQVSGDAESSGLQAAAEIALHVTMWRPGMWVQPASDTRRPDAFGDDAREAVSRCSSSPKMGPSRHPPHLPPASPSVRFPRCAGFGRFVLAEWLGARVRWA